MLDENCVEIVPNGIILPPVSDSSKSWGLGGVVDDSGSFLESSAFRFYFGGYYPFDRNEVVESESEVIFLGHLIPHWGVFLVDFTRRLWFFYKVRNPNVKIAFLGVNMPNDGFASLDPVYHDFFRYSDIGEDRILNVKKITRFRKVYVPPLGYDEDKCTINIDYLAPFNRILSNLSRKSEIGVINSKPSYKLYLSRTRFSKYKESGELIFEQFFKINGYEIVYPETLSFATQVSWISGAEELVSIEGTIAHWVLFAVNATKQTIIRKQSLLNQRQPLLNKMKDVPIEYLECYYEPFSNLPYNWDEGPFLILFNSVAKRYAKKNGLKLPPGIFLSNIHSILVYLLIVIDMDNERHPNRNLICVKMVGTIRRIVSFVDRVVRYCLKLVTN